MHGQHIAEVEFVVLLAHLPVERLELTGEAFGTHRDLDALAGESLVRLQVQPQDLPPGLRLLGNVPQPAIEQALAAVVAQADQLVAGDRQRIVEARAARAAAIVGASRDVAADQDLVGLERALRVELVATHHAGEAVFAERQAFAVAHLHREPDDRVVLRLAVHLGQHRVRLDLGEEAAALHRRKLRGIAQHQERHAERHQVAPELGVDHRAFVDHDQLRLRGRRVVPQFERRGLLAALARAIDQAVDRARAAAALAAHHQRGLAGEGRVLHLALDMRREMARERGLAGARIAEQAEQLRRPGFAGPRLEPAGDRLEGRVLMGREFGHGIREGGLATRFAARLRNNIANRRRGNRYGWETR